MEPWTIRNLETVMSPCVRNCCLDDDDVCFGCARSLDEIKEWGVADTPRRLVILQQAADGGAAREKLGRGRG